MGGGRIEKKYVSPLRLVRQTCERPYFMGITDRTQDKATGKLFYIRSYLDGLGLKRLTSEVYRCLVGHLYFVLFSPRSVFT